MILPDFILPSRCNQRWSYTGLDTAEQCVDKNHFASYPYTVEYIYNERGFRDQPWPSSEHELAQAIWCVGDSFTVGVGSPLTHTWPWLLQKRTGLRTINVSMDGASNDWIARKSIDILQKIRPPILVCHWSYIERREQDWQSALAEYNKQWQVSYRAVKDASWPDCDFANIDSLPADIRYELTHTHHIDLASPALDESRRIKYSHSTQEQDLAHTIDVINRVNETVDHCRVIHSFIPKFVPKKFTGTVESNISGPVIPELPRMDIARDGHHYDIKTSEYFVDQILKLLT